jgi:hypothetical protein
MTHELGLYQAVVAFAQAALRLSDAELEREYAWRYHDEEGLRFAFLGTYHELRDLAASLAAERAAAGRAPTTAQRILAQYHAAYRDLQAALLGVSPADAACAPAEGEWPIWLTLVHMIMTEQNFFPRIVHAAEQRRAGVAPQELADEERLDFLARDPASDSLRLLALIFGDAVKTWAVAREAPEPAALHGEYAELLGFYDATHARVLRELTALDNDDLRAPSLWWEQAEVPVEFRLHRFDAHLRQHTIQVDKTLVALGRGPSEIGRLLRLIYAALAEAEGAAIGAAELGAARVDELARAIEGRADELARLGQ